MYTSFYNLQSKPFQVSPDPSFVWLGKKHQETLTTLRYGILDNEGFLLLTGGVGTGKTTLINALISSLDDHVICGFIPDPRLETLDFLNYIALAFGLNQEFTSKGAFIIAFSHFLQKAHEQKKRVLLVIDESQLLSQELFEEIRLLSNLNSENYSILNIFFVGQNELNEVINRPENRGVSHRLTVSYNLEPLNLQETGEYINHRLKKSGSIAEIFNHSAVTEIHTQSGGLPRQINILCDHCLRTGYVAEKKVIAGTDVRACSKELSIPVYGNAVVYKEREHPDDFMDYVPSSMLFDSSPDMGSENDYIDDNDAEYFESASLEILPDPVTDPKKKAILLSIGAVSLSIMALVFLYFIFPGPFVTIYDTVFNSHSSVNNDITSGTYDSGQNSSSVMNSDVDQASLTNLENHPKLSPDNRVVQITIDESIAVVGADDKAQAKNQSPAVVGTGIKPVPVEGSVGSVDSKTQTTKKGGSIPNHVIAQDNQIIPAESDPIHISIQPQPNTAPHKQKDQPIPQIPDQTLIFKFDLNSAQFRSLDHDLIKEYVEYLIATPASIADIAGYTDSSGSSDYNHLISKFRAEIVMGYLMGKGVPKSQIKVYGFGPKKPIASNETEEGREKNRRVEVNLSSE